MSWFRKKDENEIPPPRDDYNAPPPRAPGGLPSGPRAGPGGGYRQPPPPSDPYAAPRRPNMYSENSGDSYGSQGGYDRQQAPQSDYGDRYARNRGVGDAYSRGGGDVDQDRAELFAGHNPQRQQGSGRFFDGPPRGRTPPPGEETEEDVEGIKQQSRYIKQESAQSTRNALRLAREAEETARATLGRLGDQSEKLADTERHLDVSKGHSQRADDKTDELKQLNRSIFRPVITFNKDKKRAADEAKVQARYEDERGERERAMGDVRGTQERLGRADYGDDDESGFGGRNKKTQEYRQAQRKRFQFEATASDDEVEDEIDDNLDEISKMTGRLNMLGRAMGEELESQNKRLDRLGNKTDKLTGRIDNNTAKLQRIK
ncbi:protein transporter SEC9 [Flagelloscypha sp. PMI_526]|nr:protein transporter SEC9 [Flagelloscypha sp. PMI_526]